MYTITYYTLHITYYILHIKIRNPPRASPRFTLDTVLYKVGEDAAGSAGRGCGTGVQMQVCHLSSCFFL